jgi:formylglycine-generating enzyme required for sulfatase activity
VGVTNIAPVGTATLGVGLWGQLDMAGEVYEWNLDWYAYGYVDPCTDCAHLTAAYSRVIRGGTFDSASNLRPPNRSTFGGPSTYRSGDGGFRCARTP